jgi:hypothetical protein
VEQHDAMLDWLMTPISGASTHALSPAIMWHARLMFLAWAVLLPVGALVARFYKIVPSQRWPQELDNKTWWNAHRVLQYAGMAVMTIGVAVAWNTGMMATAAARWHVLIGWLVCVLCWVQVVGALLRGSKGGPTEPSLRGDHYDMTSRRRWFERLHKTLGWLAVAGSPKVIVLGLVAVDAPRWMLLAFAAWFLCLCFVFIRLQSRGRCIDTYQAIWGPDPAHPGNRVRPTGWGVRRPRQEAGK